MSVEFPSLSRFRQAKYTGKNRCLPCTIVNIIISIFLTSIVVIFGYIVIKPVISFVCGGCVLILSLLSIYLRGYLVPGTPELTKRYFPPWLLTIFNKEQKITETETKTNPEPILVAAGALDECNNGTDLCITADFSDDWQTEIDKMKKSGGESQLLDFFNVEDGNVEYSERDEMFVARVDGTIIGLWDSKVAFFADLGAVQVLSDRISNWSGFETNEQRQLLSGLRLFAETCPSCSGTLDFRTKSIESCCSTYQIAVVLCNECGAQLFKSNINKI
ncbi:hypothetical protein [Halonotius roseus]|uniref:Uncharacterized protein n=1 Tax=Halonotius roseus TaxID=2511997 RepID=A0A544QRI6_9EURY|nr:hypothetical protein [Halonotius roseus]TQQ82045.1 hypothetical protein EWF95_03640 [Halonotius roseus]